MGVELRCENNTGCPPVIVEAKGLAGGETTVAGNVSSQFLSGLMMAAPGAERVTTIRVAGSLVSQPYVDMTLAVMRSFGVMAESVTEGGTRFVVPPARYQAGDYDIEPDASAASYFFALAAVTQGEITSISAVPRWLSDALRIDSNCFLSPENDRATNEAPSSIARAHVSIGVRSLTTPVFSFEPTSAVGENWPFVSP